MVRWMEYDLIALDEVGYVPLADVGAEFLFQVMSDRADITETGTESSRLRRTEEGRKKR
jgi:DNA replication protein DnaC